MPTSGNSINWVQWRAEDGGNDHWYAAVYTGAITWSQAKAAAESLGLDTHLATLSSAAENTFVFNLLGGTQWWSDGRGPWLGGFQPDGATEPGQGWRWVTGEPFAFTNWEYGEPNDNLGQDLLHYADGRSGRWDDIDGSGSFAGAGRVVAYLAEATSDASTIFGTPENDSLPGTADDDSIVGLAGNDTLTGLGGDDTLIGNAGADYLDGAGGNDVLLGGSGDDRLRGGGGGDSLRGDGGEDDLIGGKGDDTLNGGSSHDTLTGGEGADRFYFAPDATLATTGTDADVITDLSMLEGDRINLVRFNLPDFAALQGLLAAAGADTVITLSALPDGRDILVEGVTLAELDNAANFVL